MAKVQVRIPPKLVPLFTGPADVRASYGGRGSAKTVTFAKMTAIRALMRARAGVSGIVLCGRQFMNSLSDSSMEEIKAAIRSETWLEPFFEIGEKYIRTNARLPGRIDYAFAGLDRNIDSIKSKSRIMLCWVDEAETVSEEAWAKLIPTIRQDGSELWVTWNPESDESPTHRRFRVANDPLMKVVEMSWRDNPWFPDKLNRDRLRDQKERPDTYDWIWDGRAPTTERIGVIRSIRLRSSGAGYSSAASTSTLRLSDTRSQSSICPSCSTRYPAPKITCAEPTTLGLRPSMP